MQHCLCVLQIDRLPFTLDESIATNILLHTIDLLDIKNCHAKKGPPNMIAFFHFASTPYMYRIRSQILQDLKIDSSCKVFIG